MKTRTLLLGAAASIVLAGTANAAHFKGWYVGLEGGANWIDDTDATLAFSTIEGSTFTTAGTVSFDTGWAAIATLGYSYGENWRAEIEGGYRSNDIDGGGGSDLSEWSLMLNALYDIRLSPRHDLTLGVGAGYDWATLDVAGIEDTDGNFAYQGIVGLSYAATDRMDLTLTYRYFNVQGPSFDLVGLPFDVDDLTKHTVTVGLRFDLSPDAEPAPPPVSPPPPPPPPPKATSFLIFFGFGKCNITGEADAVLSEAASVAKASGSATVQIVGHTDSVGSAAANQKLSECRADAAKSNLVAKGIAEGAITATGKGESELLVQTGDNVKEPQNRRATIDVK